MGDRVLNGLEMASVGIVAVLYLADILYYTTIDDSWGLGCQICQAKLNNKTLNHLDKFLHLNLLDKQNAKDWKI
jgi:hypothetical protein